MWRARIQAGAAPCHLVGWRGRTLSGRPGRRRWRRPFWMAAWPFDRQYVLAGRWPMLSPKAVSGRYARPA
eukprot:7387665-Prymnesium_polylepis.1